MSRCLSLIVLFPVSLFAAEYYPAANGWVCKYLHNSVLIMKPLSSNVCGDSNDPRRGLCVGALECLKENIRETRVTLCDATSDGKCPNPGLCSMDTAFTGGKKGALASDDAVKTFWQDRKAFFDRLNEERRTRPHSSSVHD